MKSLTKFLALAVMLAASHLAHAGSIDGTLSFAGTYSGAFGPSSITFSDNPVALYNGSGNLTTYNGAAGSLTFNYPSTNNVLFAVPTAGNTALVFVASGYTFSPATTGSSATFTFTGTLEDVQYAGMVGTQVCSTTAPCILSSNSNALLMISPSGIGSGSYSASIIAPTPEPSSLLLLGTGLLCAAGLVFRRRRNNGQLVGC